MAAVLVGLVLLPAHTPTIPVAAGAAVAAEKVSLTVAGKYTVPGNLSLRWPDSGQAAISVEGVGTMATHGSVSTPVPIASVTKTMTAYLVLHDHPLNPGQSGPTITVLDSEAAAYAGQAALNQSLVHVYSGEKITERQALQALMLASADNMAQILGRWDAGSDSAFLTEMNKAAGNLGMAATHFTDPSGYDSGTRSTATDLLLLADQAMTYPAFAEIVDETSATIPDQGTVTNYNTLLGTDGVVGIKTGSTAAAGGCLLFAAHHSVNGREVTLVGVVLGIPGGSSTILPNTITAARDLLVSAEDDLTDATIAASGTPLATRTGGTVGATPTTLTSTTPITTTAWPGLTLALATTGTPTNPTLTVTAPDGTTLDTTPLTPHS